jgi:Pyridoxamine 5'-phosphate oxidase
VTATLPGDVQQVFSRFVTTEFTTVDSNGQPVTWPLTPYYKPGAQCIDVTTGLGYPKKARDAADNPKVALLFSDPTGSRLEAPPMVLVQGTAEVDDRDLDANRERYWREAREKLPSMRNLEVPGFVKSWLNWYFTRIYVHVRPERVYLWPDCDPTREPQLLDSHMEEVRSGHDEEPAAAHASPLGGTTEWDPRMDELGTRFDSAVLSLVSPDGFPFAVRVPIEVDRGARLVRIGTDALGIPVQPGLACVCAHDHDDEFNWQQNFQVRGDLIEHDGGWAIRPHRFVGGFELPPGNLQKLKVNARKARRFRRTAKRELARRG